jgi:methionyl-tRNA formyltransferase
MNIVFFGTANFALPILEQLNQHYGVKAVITTPDAKVGRKQLLQESPVALLAKNLKISTIKPENLKNNKQFLAELQNYQPDLFVVVAYGKFLPAELIEFPKYKTINIHASLLPRYRGASPIQFALWNGDAQTGTSIMLMAPELDAGPILAQKSLPIDPHDNYLTLSGKLAKLSVELLIPTIDGYVGGSIQPQPQDENTVTWSRQITKDDGKIDWATPAQKIYNQFRALHSWPGIWTTWNGQTLKITDCTVAEGNDSEHNPGTVTAGGKIVCGDNSLLQLNSVQLAGKNETDIKSFLNGYKNFIGSNLK